MSELTPEEERVLKELAKNMLAGGLLGRYLKSTLVWAASVIGAAYVVLEFVIKQRGG